MKSHNAGQLSPTLIIGLCVALVVAGSLAYAKVQTMRLDAANSLIEGYKTAGQVALKYAKDMDARNKAKKDDADAKYKRDLAALQRDNKRLRDSADSSSLPSSPAGSRSPNLACFDRQQLDDALRRFTAGTAAIATEGAEATLRLKLSRDWALSTLK